MWSPHEVYTFSPCGHGAGLTSGLSTYPVFLYVKWGK